MEVPFITTISLIWLIYTFLFTDIDKVVLDTVNRLKFALSININGEKKGAVNLSLLQVHGQMGIPELISFGKEVESVDKKGARLIKLFADKYSAIEVFKKVLSLNLFTLTAHAAVYSIFCLSNLLLLQLHILLSLILAAVFYLFSFKQLSSLVFTEIKFSDNARSASTQ